ncbi:MAG TPA: TonB-dependent receptor plug domain-containing protein [Chthoniobacterales bacterium]|jgi:Fe(3+) dicitrate transport protein
MLTSTCKHTNSIPRTLTPLLCGVAICLFTGPSLRAQTGVNVPEIPTLQVTGQALASPTPSDETKLKLRHIMPEVSGAKITVTKKATAIKLDQQPPIINNNQQELFSKAPGLLITQQQTPGQFNFSYRGLGNPQESEFILVLQDGLPITTDWIGFPTLYYTPLPQSISEVEVIRGGSSLLYGPEPAPSINYVTKHPAPGSPFSGYTEQVGGGYGTYSTFNVLQGTQGPMEYRADFGYVHSDGQRDNSESNLFQGDVYLGYRPDESQLWAFDFHAYHVSVGDPGRLTIQQYDDDPNFSPTPYNHDWVDRYNVTLSHEHDFGGGWYLEAKGWFTYQAIDNRTAANLGPNGELPTSTTIQSENYYNGGVDLRVRKRYGEGTMLRGSALTFGGVVYHGEAPFQQFINPDIFADENDEGVTRLDQDRTTNYQAFFAENIFRFGPFHIVPSFRLDHETVEVDENVTPFPRTPLEADVDHVVPLWGIGLGNDFGHGNETYFSASSGWRPTRFFDVVSPFSPTFTPGHPSDPFTSLDFELGVHGTPAAIPGLWYDVGLFWMNFDNRTETTFLNPGVNNDTILINSGSTRHRGFEGEIAYDLLQLTGNASPTGPHLVVSGNLQILDAEFTDSTIPNQVGKDPAFAPDTVLKAALSFRKDHSYDFRISATAVSSQYFQDSNLPATAADGTVLVPAKIPAFFTIDFSAEYYLSKNCRLIAGVSNLTNQRYYSRVFGSRIEPAPALNGYAGISIGF